MADASKWDKTLEALKRSQAVGQTDTQQPAGTAPVRVRPRSKRSDPAWRPYTLMLKIATHTEASIILKRLDTGQDLSDLAQELFEEWVQKHT